MNNCVCMRPALKEAILKSSVSDKFEVAAGEWYINYYEVMPPEEMVSCVCGQENCMYIYSIKNLHNEKTLYPIGSSCMKYFNWNEEEAEILSAYRKWHDKPYKNEGGRYNGIAFNQVIKDVDYIKKLNCYSSAENGRLCAYAKAVWIHNPPAIPVKKKKPDCERCKIQRQKGYPRCYQCHLIKNNL